MADLLPADRLGSCVGSYEAAIAIAEATGAWAWRSEWCDPAWGCPEHRVTPRRVVRREGGAWRCCWRDAEGPGRPRREALWSAGEEPWEPLYSSRHAWDWYVAPPGVDAEEIMGVPRG